MVDQICRPAMERHLSKDGAEEALFSGEQELRLLVETIPAPVWRAGPEGTVLVIDDDPALRASIGRLLRSLDLDARLFASIPEFLESDPPNGCACLVLDVRLPGRSGLDLQRELAMTNQELPIIALPASRTPRIVGSICDARIS